MRIISVPTDFLLVPASLVVSVLASFGASHWASNRSSRVRNVVSFCFAAVSSYAIGFVVDMLLSAAAGELPGPNVVLPVGTWLLISAISLYSARHARGSSFACGTPFWLNAALALLASVFRVRNVAVAAALILAGMVVAHSSGHAAVGEIEDINSPEIQGALRRLNRLQYWTIWAHPITMPGALSTSLWLFYLAFKSAGFAAVFGWLIGLGVVYQFGMSPMFAVTSSALSFYFNAVGLWLPILSYIVAAVLLYVDMHMHSLKQRVDPYNLGSVYDI